MKDKAPAKRVMKRVYRRPANTMTVAILVDALRKNAGIRAQAARMLKVDRSAVTRFIDRHPEILEVLAEIDHEINDLAEGALIKQIKAGDTSAIRFRLERKARDRGYARNLEITGREGGPVDVAVAIFALPDNGRN